MLKQASPDPAVAVQAQDAAETLAFRPSQSNTLGVELELQIIDPQKGDLAPGAVRILKACDEEGLSNVSAELMQSMIEVKTGICRSATEVQGELIPLLRRVRNIASSLGYQLAWGGTHPFSRGVVGAVSPGDRYERIQNRLAWITYQRVVFGMHVHVGVPSGDIAMGVTSMLVQYLPHLLALSASSPFWHGEDTGLASCRTALYRMLPHAGVPRYFKNWREFRNFYRVMRDAQSVESPKDIYWDIRPSPDLGTIEFRICDMPALPSQAWGLTSLIQCLVKRAQQLLQDRPHLCRGDIRRHWVAIENKWLATRYGLSAVHIRTPSGKRGVLHQDAVELIDQMKPLAEETGDAGLLAALRPGKNYESTYHRQRRIFRESGDWKGLVADMTNRWAEEL